MILVDAKGHMVSDISVGELHFFADCVGIKRCWFRVGRGHPHYDLTTADKLMDALRSGALFVTTRMLVERMARR